METEMRRWLGLMVVALAFAAPAGAAWASSFDSNPGSGPGSDPGAPAFAPQPPAQPIETGGIGGVTKTLHRLVRGTGSVHALGRVGTAVFSIDLRKGPGHKVTYVDARQGVRFRSLSVGSLRFGTASATFNGTGVVNGRRVRFAISAVDRGSRQDVFRIAWGGGAGHGGVLLAGGLTVR
ncbi:MAG: hypothetical protein QOK22_1745 [Gaiellaceae bacterium]|nr:hypothetical protein [Gaiellaceae bacterium]